jgi:hypothetical protein
MVPVYSLELDTRGSRTCSTRPLSITWKARLGIRNLRWWNGCTKEIKEPLPNLFLALEGTV